MRIRLAFILVPCVSVLHVNRLPDPVGAQGSPSILVNDLDLHVRVSPLMGTGPIKSRPLDLNVSTLYYGVCIFFLVTWAAGAAHGQLMLVTWAAGANHPRTSHIFLSSFPHIGPYDILVPFGSVQGMECKEEIGLTMQKWYG